MKKIFSVLSLVMSLLAMTAMSAFALSTNTGASAALFDAGDISGLAGNVSTLLVGFIGIGLLFVGYRYIRKSGVK